MTTKKFVAPDDMDRKAEVDAFYEEVAAADLQPLWTQKGLMLDEPPIRDVPFVWKWERIKALAQRSGELIPIDRGGDRRVLSLTNPGLDGLPYASSTLWGAIQYLGPQEVAPAHRHSPAALRFVMEGSGVWTLVNGDPVAMHPGDLVLTPSWTWHEHHNPFEQPMMWFDALDLPLVRSLDALYYEDGPDFMTNRAVDEVSGSELRYGGGAGLVPLDADEQAPAYSPLLAYRWAETDRALTSMMKVANDGHAALRFADPTTGRDVMPTMRCAMHRLGKGGHMPLRQSTGSSLWVTFQGSAIVTIAGEEYQLAQGDCFVVPSWAPFGLSSVDGADFFAVSDTPVLEALGLARVRKL
ncbi:MAG: cupin domain-containing protein [Acidimicrobiales bacterium]